MWFILGYGTAICNYMVKDAVLVEEHHRIPELPQKTCRKNIYLHIFVSIWVIQMTLTRAWCWSPNLDLESLGSINQSSLVIIYYICGGKSGEKVGENRTIFYSNKSVTPNGLLSDNDIGLPQPQITGADCLAGKKIHQKRIGSQYGERKSFWSRLVAQKPPLFNDSNKICFTPCFSPEQTEAPHSIFKTVLLCYWDVLESRGKYWASIKCVLPSGQKIV